MSEKRAKLLDEIWESQNTAYSLMAEYDSLPHKYGDVFLRQTEAHLIDLVALHPDITITDLAGILRKTPSACSQIVRKMCTAGWIEQIRNENNKRQFNLRLTDEGKQIFHHHMEFENICMERTHRRLDRFSEDELDTYLAIQQSINEAYREDVQISRYTLSEAQK